MRAVRPGLTKGFSGPDGMRAFAFAQAICYRHPATCLHGFGRMDRLQSEQLHRLCEQSIWSHNPAELARRDSCDRNSWPGSVQKEVLEFSIDPDLTSAPGPFPGYDKCAVLSMVKDEADIIRANLLWLYHVGARRFVILDNMSTDGTYAELLRFQAQRPDANLVVVRDEIVAHYQGEKITGIAQFARSMWPDLEWLIPVDADEFCVARHGLVALAYVPESIDALTIPKTIHFLQAGQQADSLNPLERMPVRSQLFVVPPKICIRARPYLGVTQGNHYARPADDREIVYAGGFQYGLYHREFQTRSYEQLLGKIRNGGAAILAARAEGRDVGGDHWIEWYEVLTGQGEEAFRAKFEAECFREPGPHFRLDPFLGVESAD